MSNATFLSHQGIIIENSGANGIIQVANNNSHHNTIPGGETEAATGIFINNSDDVRIRNNTVQNNGELGVDISAGSDDNRLIDNTITDNPTDLINEGAGNCGSGNTIGTEQATRSLRAASGACNSTRTCRDRRARRVTSWRRANGPCVVI